MKRLTFDLKIPHQSTKLEEDEKEPSTLHLIQLGGRGFQMTSLITGALGRWMGTLKALRTTKSN